ncbi:MAG: ABC transporter ATP-binding protein [Methanoregula sp.]|nr:ABC transporter ATP-binding protein [Methanoregula sp.]
MKTPPSFSTLFRDFSSARSDIFRAVRLVFTNAPFLTVINIVLVFIQGLLPLAALYIMKLLVDTVTNGIAATDKVPVINNLIFLLAIATAIALLLAVCRAISAYSTEVQSLVLTDIITDQIQAHSISLDLAYYENPAYHDNLHRAQMEGPSRPSRVVNDLVQLCQNSVSICAVGGFILIFSPVVGIILIGAALPSAVFRVWYSRRLYTLRMNQTETERRSQYYHMMITDMYHSKEIRLFGLGLLFRNRYRDLQNGIRKARLAISRSKVFWDIVGQGFVTAAIFGSFAVIALMTIGGTVTLGDMVMYFMGFQMCIGYTQSIFSSLNALYEDQLFLRNLFRFFDLVPQIAAPENPVPVPSPIKEEIRFEGVTFTYPGATTPSLSQVNLTLHKGEIIALVGVNGAGKSTVIKLLCRLYEPLHGKITVDGLDLKKTDPEEWRRHITVLFQDFVRYSLSVRENIWLGDVSQSCSTPRVQTAAKEAAAESAIEKLPNTYSSLLGKHFSGGQELSTGEWQKVALARTFFRDAEIVILDEPASSIDALSEAEIFHRFRELVKGRTAVIISHRFSTVLLADHIYVFDRGKIIEHGTQTDLMALSGHYADMFRAQAEPYRQ